MIFLPKKVNKKKYFKKYYNIQHFRGLKNFDFVRAFSCFVLGQSLSKNYSGKLSFSIGFWPVSSVFRQVRQSYHKIPKIRQFRQFLGLKIATGDVSPALISHRHRGAQNRGFGDISPEMLTLPAALELNSTPLNY